MEAGRPLLQNHISNRAVDWATRILASVCDCMIGEKGNKKIKGSIWINCLALTSDTEGKNSKVLCRVWYTFLLFSWHWEGEFKECMSVFVPVHVCVCERERLLICIHIGINEYPLLFWLYHQLLYLPLLAATQSWCHRYVFAEKFHLTPV